MSSYDYYGGGDGSHGQQPPQQQYGQQQGQYGHQQGQGYNNYPPQAPAYGQQSHDQYGQGQGQYNQQQQHVSAITLCPARAY